LRSRLLKAIETFVKTLCRQDLVVIMHIIRN